MRSVSDLLVGGWGAMVREKFRVDFAEAACSALCIHPDVIAAWCEKQGWDLLDVKNVVTVAWRWNMAWDHWGADNWLLPLCPKWSGPIEIVISRTCPRTWALFVILIVSDFWLDVMVVFIFLDRWGYDQIRSKCSMKSDVSLLYTIIERYFMWEPLWFYLFGWL